MIDAVCCKLDDHNRIKLYPVGMYNSIDWDTPYPSQLGDMYTEYACKTESQNKPAILVRKSFDDSYVLRVIETKRYMVRIDSDADSPVELPRFQNENNKFLKIDRDDKSVSFQFVNYLGRSRMIFELPDRNIDIPFEVIPDKMSYEDDYIALTESIAQVCSELLLEYSGSTSNVFSTGEENSKTLLEQFIFLRQFCYEQNIQGLFESIKRNPDRILVSEEAYKPFGCGMPSRKFYTNPFAHSRGWQPVGDSGSGRFMPQEVAVTQKYDSLDTPANRFIKFALAKFKDICDRLVATAGQGKSDLKQAECISEASVISGEIDDIMRSEFFVDVGELDIMPQNNQVLQKREGYSQLFAAYSMVDLALQLDWKGKDDVYEGESKNVALLYEYWLFFELYKIIKSIDGCETLEDIDSPFVSTVNDELTLSLEQDRKSCQAFIIKKYGVKVNLYYNRTFSKNDFASTRYEGSYSRPFRPDYTIAVFPEYYTEKAAVADGTVSYIHFDAKYRITDLTAFIGKSEDGTDLDEASEVEEDKVESVVNTYRRGDLLKMHTYNDAIRRTVGSYVLYPGSDSNEGKRYQLYDEILPGVGAFAIKPSNDRTGESKLREFIEELIRSRSMNDSRLNRLSYYMESIIREPRATSSSGVIGKTAAKEVPSEQCIIGYVRNDKESDYYAFLKRSGLLAIGSEFIFYFYAIKDKNVYSHHKDVFTVKKLRLYSNDIRGDGAYILEPFMCSVTKNELISKEELVKRLADIGYITNPDSHGADFYYTLTVQVTDENVPQKIIKTEDVNRQNGNDTFSPHSPKIILSGSNS